MNNYADLIFTHSGTGKDPGLVDRNGSLVLSRRELYEGACRVARAAKSRQLKGIIPICMERGHEYVISLLGLSMAGIGVAPLSYNTPEDRIALIEEQTESKTWRAADYEAAVSGEFMPFEAVDFEDKAPAYVVFTSGSTGIPKGVVLSNRSIETAILRISGKDFYDYSGGEKALQSSSFSFVALVLDLLSPLYSGCTVYILPEEARSDTVLMGEFINRYGINSLWITPKPLARLGSMPSMRVVVCGGERVSGLVSKNYRLVSAWGMSETAATAMSYEVKEAMDNTPIGKASYGIRSYIVDDNGEPADEGELCISGGIAEGYLGNPELTEKIFTPNPYSQEPGHETLVHSGDIVRRMPDGNLLYLNRKDFMLKINGQRVEPGEAEAVISKIPGVTGVCVKGFTEADGYAYLCAFYTGDDNINEELLRQELDRRLPSYMIPSFYVKLAALPLNANGKLNRTALKAPRIGERRSVYEAPGTEEEARLCRAFEQALGLKHIGVNDDFVRLGGDSIRAMSVVETAGIPGLRVTAVLRGRTPRAIGAALSGEAEDIYSGLPTGISRAPLTASQTGIYLDCVRSPESTMYNIPFRLSFDRGQLSREEVRSALERVISLHPALLSHIEADRGQVFMVRSDRGAEGLCRVYEADEAAAEELFSREPTPFELSRAPLFLVEAVLTDEKVHVFMDIHHIVADGSSVSVLVRQLCSLLSGESVGAEKTDAFSLYELEKREQSEPERAGLHYSRLLSDVEIDSRPVFDRQPSADCHSALRRSYMLEGLDLTEPSRAGITPGSFFMGVFGYALARVTGQSGSLFTAAESGRKNAAVSDTVSMMVRTLPVVMTTDENERPFDLLLRLQDQFMTSRENDCYPFGRIAEEYGVSSDVAFVYQSDMLSGFESPLGRVELSFMDQGDCFGCFAASVFEEGGSFRLCIECRSDCYNEATAERFGRIFRMIAEGFADNIRLKDISICDSEDFKRIEALNSSILPYNNKETIIDVFRRIAAEHPERGLVSCRDRHISYSEGNSISDRLAAYISSLGIGRGDAVSVLIPRCEYMVLASLGIMKAGAVYQPLDPTYPMERLSFMCRDAGSRLIIADRELGLVPDDFTGRVLYTDEIPSLPEPEVLPKAPALDDPYILLYTSGTTGTPKGCMLVHSNLMAMVYGYIEVVDLEEGSKAAAYASYGFDAHMADIYPIMVLGAEVHIITEDIRFDLPALKRYFEENGITHSIMTTQLFRQFVARYPDVKGFKCIMAGGEKLASFEPNMNYRLINGYGPTEGTIISTYFVVDRLYEDIPIGKAFPNMWLYVVDSQGRRVPPGVPGELVICGPQIGIGYLNRPEQTARAFVPNTFGEAVPTGYEHCYRTGDIVRLLEDGNLSFVGRRDHQVKIRGFRIELGEVADIIRRYKGIKDAVVVVGDAPDGSKCIYSYIVAEKTIDIEELNGFIAANKPPYMVPAATMQIDKIPLTVNGKVDKRRLPKPELHFDHIERPETELQKRIFGIVAELLGTESFGINTDLFRAGLSSISSIRLCTCLAEEFDITVQIRNLKKHSTVRELEGFVEKALGRVSDSSEVALKTEPPEIKYTPDHPISKVMEGVFVECTRRPDSTFYNIPYLLKLSAGIDADRLKKAMVKAVEAHPYMLTELFTDSEGRVRQHRPIDGNFVIEDIKDITVDSIDAAEAQLIRPFVITGGRLFEISFIHSDGLYLLFNFHHIISDGTSINIFIRDMEKAYRGEELKQESFDGFDVAEEEQRARAGEELEDARTYYTELLEGLDRDFLPLPDRLPEREPACGKLTLEALVSDTDTIRSFCETEKVSMNAFFVSAFGLVLSRFAGTDYSVFSTFYNGRNDSRCANSFAMLVKTLPVVCRTDTDTVAEYVRAVSGQLMDSMANDLYSFGEISRALGVKSDVMFIYQGDSFERSGFCGEPVEELALRLSDSKAPVSFQVMIKGDRLVFDLEYDPALYTEAMAESIISSFDKVCSEFCLRAQLSRVSLLTEKAEALMDRYNSTEYAYDRSQTVTGMFLEQVRAHPDSLCVAYKDTRLSYRDVEELSGRLALYLMKQGVGNGDVVPVLINRNECMVYCSYGVIRSGAAYVGLDPTYPSSRLELMVSDCSCGYLVAERSLADRLPNYSGRIIYTDEIPGFDALTSELAMSYGKEEKHRITPETDVVYLYSSGTTGVPKGAVLQHKAMVCYFINYSLDHALDSSSRVACYASYGFDGGACDSLCTGMAGAALYVIPDEIRLDMSRLEEFYNVNSITMGFMTTQVGTMFMDNTKCRSLKHFLVGGERFIPVTGPDWVEFANGYGPSETICYVNRYVVNNRGSLQPIGPVSRNMKEYIIDRFGNRLPFGACGELCISGGQMGRGYHNRPEKTAQVFVDNPFNSMGEYRRMYRTGDTVRLLPDGNYVFVGRRDGQVKIRGFRVELPEIEQQIRKFPGITDTTVTAPDNPGGGKYIAAYVVSPETVDLEALKAFIALEKPDYMVPAAIMQIDRIPLTSNGKVAVSALPKAAPTAARKGIEPADETEETVCRIFAEVLGLDKVYADDDFFAIGGTSISAIQVIIKCGHAGLELVYKNLFANPTAQGLAAFLHGSHSEDIMAEDLEKGDGHDYSALKYNTMDRLPSIKNEGLGDMLLTGATGFLGSHVFRELISGGSGKITCIVRSKADMPAEVRFKMMMVYYFEDWFTDAMMERVNVVDGDIEDDACCERLSFLHFDTIINCAANVKHFAAGDSLLNSNFTGVENLIRVTERTGARLIQISSLSVSGESVNGSVPAGYIFKETDLNIGQSLENKYVYTKYLAEQAVIDAVSRGRIRGKVIRLGNLMARWDDSEFQVNAGTNGFLRLFIGFCALGCMPMSMMDGSVEFSPIDYVAKAICLLSGTPDRFTVFHAKNCNSIHYGYFLLAMQKAGIKVEVVSDEIYQQRLDKALEKDENADILGGLLSYKNTTGGNLGEVARSTAGDGAADESCSRIKITSSTAFTVRALYHLGFAWPLISMDYLEKMVDVLKEMNFFTVNNG